MINWILSNLSFVVTLSLGTIALATIFLKWGDAILKKITQGAVKEVNVKELPEDSPIRQEFEKITEDIEKLQEEMVILRKNAIHHDKEMMKGITKIDINQRRSEIMIYIERNHEHEYDSLIRRLAVDYFSEGHNHLLLEDINKSLREPLNFKYLGRDLL